MILINFNFFFFSYILFLESLHAEWPTSYVIYSGLNKPIHLSKRTNDCGPNTSQVHYIIWHKPTGRLNHSNNTFTQRNTPTLGGIFPSRRIGVIPVPSAKQTAASCRVQRPETYHRGREDDNAGSPSDDKSARHRGSCQSVSDRPSPSFVIIFFRYLQQQPRTYNLFRFVPKENILGMFVNKNFLHKILVWFSNSTLCTRPSLYFHRKQ